jgi:hypothetical protein
MTLEQHLEVLGPEFVAEMRRRAAAAPPPTAEVIAAIQPVLAPAMARVEARLTTEAHPLAA